MRKAPAAILLITLTLILAACSNGSDPQPIPEHSTVQDQASPGPTNHQQGKGAQHPDPEESALHSSPEGRSTPRSASERSIRELRPPAEGIEPHSSPEATMDSPAPEAATHDRTSRPEPVPDHQPQEPCSQSPCLARDVSAFHVERPAGQNQPLMSVTQEPTLEEYLEQGPRLAGHSPVHLAVRGTPIENSIRCSWRGTARTRDQRDNAVRAWLGKQPTDTVPDTGYLEILFDTVFQVAAPDHQALIRANFQAIALGESREYLFLTCHADYTIHEYILGAGPATLTVAYDRMGESPSYELYLREFYNGEYPDENIRTEGEHQDLMLQTLAQGEETLAEITGSNEAVLFLTPMGADHRIGIETWLTVLQWDLQKDDDEVVHAIRYGAPTGDPEYSQTLANLKARITTAAAQDSHADDRIANSSGLKAYYRQIGAYSDITPGDGSTDTFTPAQPPQVTDCASGPAVTGNPALTQDCQNLLDTRDTLRGTAALNWDKATAMSSWDGVHTSGTPPRVTNISMPTRGLNGSLPASLGSLFELTNLDLSGNSLTGTIPHELGWLHNLHSIRLFGNSLTGCIPVAMKDIPDNDLSLLVLPYCQPPSPTGLTAVTAGTTSATLSWDAVTGASRYRVEQRPGIGTGWNEHAGELTTTTHVATGLRCGTGHEFRVSAFGSGTIYSQDWSEPSEPTSASTNPCPPEFGEEGYAFMVRDDIISGTAVGTVTAENAASYSFTSGNDDGKFAIDNTGEITTTGPLDYAATQEYSLSVQADNGQGETDTAEVQIDLTKGDCHNGTVVPSPDDNPRLVRDCSALLTARDNLRGTADINWSKDRAMTRWEGLTIERNVELELIRIVLTDKNLDGSIPPILGRLQDLKRLDLDDNALTGPIPAELAGIQTLKDLFLFENRLSGPIPAELGNLPALRNLSLYHNRLAGSIPSELGQLTSLRQLLLDGNQLTGGIPTELGNMTSLEHLLLRDNNLSGSVPSELEDLENLTHLYLDGNSLTGCIPTSLQDTANHDLGELGLAYCQ